MSKIQKGELVVALLFIVIIAVSYKR